MIRVSIFQDLFGKKKGIRVNGGILVTVPTAITLAQGIIGSKFKKIEQRPELDLEELFGLTINQIPSELLEAQEIISDYLLLALDDLSAILIETSLGNGGHFGLGGFVKTKTPISTFIQHCWAANWKFRGLYSLEFLFSNDKKISYVLKPNLAAFNAHDFNNPAKGSENLDFIETEVTNKLFPFVYETSVRPGFIFRWSSSLAYDRNKWGLSIGTDYWYQAGDHFGNICAPEKQIALLDIKKARRISCWQYDVIGSLYYKYKRKDRDWIFSLNFDATVQSKGIGEKYALGFNVEVNF